MIFIFLEGGQFCFFWSGNFFLGGLVNKNWGGQIYIFFWRGQLFFSFWGVKKELGGGGQQYIFFGWSIIFFLRGGRNFFLGGS